MFSSRPNANDVHGTFSRPWVTMTGQTWKLVVFLILCILVLAFLVLMVLAMDKTSPVPKFNEATSAIFGVLSGAAALLWLCLSVRCKACRARVAWHVLKTADAGKWGWQLMSLRVCPVCCHAPGVGQGSNSEREASSRVV